MINENKILNLIENFEPYGSAETITILMEYAKLKSSIQNYRTDKTLYVLVGPSGSGKSTFIANMYKQNIFGNSEHNFVPFVNRHYASQNMTLEEEIAFKTNLLDQGKSFMIESAQFDEKYCDFIKVIKSIYDYDVCLIYMTKNHPQENISMVKKRKTEGGHGTEQVELNEDVITKMYKIDSQNLIEILPYCDSCFIINNQTMEKGDKITKPVVLLQKQLNGKIVYNRDYKYADFLYRQILKSQVPRKPKQTFRIAKPVNSQTLKLLRRTSKKRVLFLKPMLEKQIEATLKKLSLKPIQKDEFTMEEIESILKGEGRQKK